MKSDLRADHPQSFGDWAKDTSNPNFETMHDSLYTSKSTRNSAVALWQGRIECTTCHDPHTPNNDLNRPSKFLSLDNTNGNLCKVCHDVTKNAPNVLAGWATSAHNLSSSTEGSATTGYRNVTQGACMNCHVPHRSGSDRLLRNPEEKTCFTCHADSNGNSQLRWTQVWVGNTDPTKFMHPVQANGHQPIEDLSSATTARHSECWDCHDAHAMKTSGASISPLQAELAAATGIDQFKNPVNPAQHTYEVCFKCHADSANKPQGTVDNYSKYGYTPLRQVPSHNLRLDLTSTISRHNVVQQRRTANSTPADRSNILKLDNNAGRDLTSGLIHCGDCHSGNNPSNDGGTGPNGPHISANEHILERPYEMNKPPAVVGASVISLSVPPNGGDAFDGPFGLCNKCHDVAGLLGGTLPGPGLSQVPGPKDTVFKHHNSHVVQGGISCAVCHAPHGVNSSDSQQHAHSINLDTKLTGPDLATNNWYIDTQSRTCFVSCHYTNDSTGIGMQHSGISYDKVFSFNSAAKAGATRK